MKTKKITVLVEGRLSEKEMNSIYAGNDLCGLQTSYLEPSHPCSVNFEPPCNLNYYIPNCAGDIGIHFYIPMICMPEEPLHISG